MAPVRRFLSLPWREKVLLFKVVLLVLATRVAITLLPFQVVTRSLSRLARPKNGPQTNPHHADIDRIVWFTEATGRRLRGIATCLTQALTAYVLLGRRGYETNLRIGVTRDDAGQFVGHAWLEKGDRIVIGQRGVNLERYTSFPAFKGLEPLSSPTPVRPATRESKR